MVKPSQDMRIMKLTDCMPNRMRLSNFFARTFRGAFGERPEFALL